MAGLRVPGKKYPTREMTVSSSVNFLLDVRCAQACLPKSGEAQHFLLFLLLLLLLEAPPAGGPHSGQLESTRECWLLG